MVYLACVAAVALLAFAAWKVFSGDRKMESKNTKIVIVGMERSAKFGRCQGSAHDAETMRGILSKYGEPVVLRDSAAKRASVSRALLDGLDSDLLIFFYSGHGGSQRAKPGSGEEDGMDEYLCLYDGAMMDDEVWSIISKARGRVMCIFDCCHSATMFQSLEAESGTPEFKPSPFTFRKLSGPMEQANVNLLVWSGCPDSDYSYGDDDGGVLTNAIAKAYKPSRTYDDVWERASKDARGQRPTSTQIGSGFGGNVFQ